MRRRLQKVHFDRKQKTNKDGGYGGDQITGITLPFTMKDANYQVLADVKIGSAFSVYAGANKAAGSFDMILWATTTGAQAIKAWVTIAGYKE